MGIIGFISPNGIFSEINPILTFLLSVFGLIFLIVRIYNAFFNGIADRKLKELDKNLKTLELKNKTERIF